jgi:hypothetical protein
MKISIIQPSRNNLKYLKWSYDAIRKNQGEHTVEICVADDYSDKDDTWLWCQEMMRNDPHFRAIRNEGPTRVGHTILYDRLVNEVASHDICMIYHADMYLCPGALDEIEKNIGSKKIVSLTRIEPPLHPPGPEKILLDCGTEPEQFDEQYLLNFLDGIIGKSDYLKCTSGIFAPWAFMKSDFQEIGGHDPLYAPQSKEDSDIFNRFQLNGVEFIQTWQGFVYHMTCRGSRFNPTLTTPGQNSPEWEAQNQRSTRNFIRKWGHFVKHDTYMKPIIPPKYNIGFIIHNCTDQLLNVLEPWCTDVYVDISPDQYIWNEQPNTKFDLLTRIHDMSLQSENDVVVTIDGRKFTNDDFYIIQELSSIIQQTNDTGEFGISNLNINIKSLATYENDLITCQNNIYNK